jgi:hypothetical protein
VRPIAPSYLYFEYASRGLDSPQRADARPFDTAALAREAVAFSLAATRTLRDAGQDAVHVRAAGPARRLAETPAERGRRVAPRGETTLVAWGDPDPPAARGRLVAAGVVIRDLPGTPLLRASLGA